VQVLSLIGPGKREEDSAVACRKMSNAVIFFEKTFSLVEKLPCRGKSLLWGKATQRWSDFDFDGRSEEWFAVDWPIRAKI